MRIAPILVVCFSLALIYLIFDLVDSPENYSNTVPFLFISFSGIVHSFLLSQTNKKFAIIWLIISFSSLSYLLNDLSSIWDFWKLLSTYHLLLIWISLLLLLNNYRTSFFKWNIVLVSIPLLGLTLHSIFEIQDGISNIVIKVSLLLGLLAIISNQIVWLKSRKSN